jgi:hypothetical protein
MLPIGSDGRPILIAGLWYQPVVKIISLTVRNMKAVMSYVVAQ